MSALVLTGNLKVGAYTGVLATDKAAATVVGSEITQFKVTTSVDTIEVPATMTTPIHGRGGATDFAITIAYLSNDIASTLFTSLWAALTSSSGLLFFLGTMRSGSVATTNPAWSGAMLVTEASIGGAYQTLSTGSATFPLIGAPLKETS